MDLIRVLLLVLLLVASFAFGFWVATKADFSYGLIAGIFVFCISVPVIHWLIDEAIGLKNIKSIVRNLHKPEHRKETVVRIMVYVVGGLLLASTIILMLASLEYVEGDAYVENKLYAVISTCLFILCALIAVLWEGYQEK